MTWRSFPPTFLLAVPRVFEKVYNGARQQRPQRGQGQDLRRGGRHRHRVDPGARHRGPVLALRLRHALFDRLVYGRLRAALGGNVVAAVSGSAPLGDRLGHFFRGVGLPVLEGYGLTETSAASPSTPWPRSGSAPWAARSPGSRPDRRRRGDHAPRPDRVPRLLEEPRPRRPRRSTTAGSTAATSASSTTPASCASPAARRRSSSRPAARTSRPQCWRTACARTRWSASAWSSATGSRSSPRW